jgi:hypothetical protein
MSYETRTVSDLTDVSSFSGFSSSCVPYVACFSGLSSSCVPYVARFSGLSSSCVPYVARGTQDENNLEKLAA